MAEIRQENTDVFRKKMPFNGAFSLFTRGGGNVDPSGQRHVSKETSPKSKLDTVAGDDDA